MYCKCFQHRRIPAGFVPPIFHSSKSSTAENWNIFCPGESVVPGHHRVKPGPQKVGVRIALCDFNGYKNVLVPGTRIRARSTFKVPGTKIRRSVFPVGKIRKLSFALSNAYPGTGTYVKQDGKYSSQEYLFSKC
eukprot:1628585-Rhodomonas_salina.1